MGLKEVPDIKNDAAVSALYYVSPCCMDASVEGFTSVALLDELVGNIPEVVMRLDEISHFDDCGTTSDSNPEDESEEMVAGRLSHSVGRRARME